MLHLLHIGILLALVAKRQVVEGKLYHLLQDGLGHQRTCHR
jgi:hypothetical protein